MFYERKTTINTTRKFVLLLSVRFFICIFFNISHVLVLRLLWNTVRLLYEYTTITQRLHKNDAFRRSRLHMRYRLIQPHPLSSSPSPSLSSYLGFFYRTEVPFRSFWFLWFFERGGKYGISYFILFPYQLMSKLSKSTFIEWYFHTLLSLLF
jgi:hypothetical protein